MLDVLHGAQHLTTEMQAHVSQLALKHVLAALAQHPEDIDIQAKGMVVLGVLGQVHFMLATHVTLSHAMVCCSNSGIIRCVQLSNC